MLTIPDIQLPPTFPAQSSIDSTDIAAQQLRGIKTGVVSGCAVTQHSGSDMNVAVAAGVIAVAGVDVTVAAVTSLAIGAASSFDRRDIVVVNSSAVVSVVAGTPCSTAGWIRASAGDPPVKPNIPANSVLLAEVYVASTTTAITTAANIIDKSVVIPDPQAIPSSSFATAATATVLAATTVVTLFTSATLQPGLYSVKAVVTLQGGASASNVDAWFVMGSGGAASQGLISSTCECAASKPSQVVLTTDLLVTAAGTLLLKVEASTANQLASTSQGPANMPNATSLTITQLH